MSLCILIVTAYLLYHETQCWVAAWGGPWLLWWTQVREGASMEKQVPDLQRDKAAGVCSSLPVSALCRASAHLSPPTVPPSAACLSLFSPCLGTPLPQQERWALSPAMRKCWGWCKESFINQMRSREAPSTLSLTTMTEPWTQTWLVSSHQVSVQGELGKAVVGKGRDKGLFAVLCWAGHPAFLPSHSSGRIWFRIFWS